MPNPENVFDGAIKTGVQFMYTVPAFIEVGIFQYNNGYADAFCVVVGPRAGESRCYEEDEGLGQ